MVVNTKPAAQKTSSAFDPAGNLATYSLPALVDGKAKIRAKKINGQWLLDAIND